MAGYFQGTASFGGTTLTSSGTQNIFVAKYSSTGALLRVVPVQGSNYQTVYGITTDNLGNSYIAALFDGTAYF